MIDPEHSELLVKIFMLTGLQNWEARQIVSEFPNYQRIAALKQLDEAVIANEAAKPVITYFASADGLYEIVGRGEPQRIGPTPLDAKKYLGRASVPPAPKLGEE